MLKYVYKEDDNLLIKGGKHDISKGFSMGRCYCVKPD